MYDIFYLKKDGFVDDNKFNKLKSRFPLIKKIDSQQSKYEALSLAKKKSLTKFFWIIDLDVDYNINDNFCFDYVAPDWDAQYVHVWKTSKHEFKMVYLISKEYHFTKKEADYLFFINKKEITTEASKVGYDILQLNLDDDFYDKIISFQRTVTTSMFWVLAPECKLLTELSYLVPDYDKEYVHQWIPINHESPNLFLIPKDYPISKREANHLFFISKQEMEDKISKVGYDILQLDFKESIYDKITSFQSTTSMFWVLPTDCKLLTDLFIMIGIILT